MKAFNLESNAALVLFSGGSRLSRQIIAPGGDNAETSYADVDGEQVTIHRQHCLIFRSDIAVLTSSPLHFSFLAHAEIDGDRRLSWNGLFVQITRLIRRKNR
jgi:hypothetical protein